MFKKRQQINIGIDVGSAFIKAVAIDKSKTPYELVSFFSEPLNNNKAGSIKKAAAALAVPGANINTSVCGQQTTARLIEMPKMTERELKSAVKFEAEKYIPYKTEDVITDCIKIEDLPGGKLSVLLAAAKKSIINERINLFSEAGIELSAIDIDSLAVMNAFLNSQGQTDKETAYALINAGAKTININIARGEQTYLLRDIQAEGNDMSQALAEIRFSFDFYENHYGKTIQKVFISGGNIKPGQLDEGLKEVFGGDVVFWDPFNNIKMGAKVKQQELDPIKGTFAVAVGLGLREN